MEFLRSKFVIFGYKKALDMILNLAFMLYSFINFTLFVKLMKAVATQNFCNPKLLQPKLMQPKFLQPNILQPKLLQPKTFSTQIFATQNFATQAFATQNFFNP